MLTILSNGLRSSHEYKVFVPLGQIRRRDVIQPLFSVSVIMTNVEKSYLMWACHRMEKRWEDKQDKHCTNVVRYGETRAALNSVTYGKMSARED